jgi:hypothetical protein
MSRYSESQEGRRSESAAQTNHTNIFKTLTAKSVFFLCCEGNGNKMGKASDCTDVCTKRSVWCVLSCDESAVFFS